MMSGLSTRHLLPLVACATFMLTLVGCTYQAAVQRLSLSEKAEFRAYKKIMHPSQKQSYLSKASAAERTTYLAHIGLAQRFQNLAPEDRASVLAGYIREGMSANALKFLWGDPRDHEGARGENEYWIYQGSAYELADHSNDYINAGNEVKVYLVDGRVKWWLETPTEDAGEEDEQAPWDRN